MGKATATRDQLAILASRVGLVENSEAGRETFKAALAANPRTVRANLFKKVAAQRAQASATHGMGAGTGTASAAAHPTAYPSSWGRRTLGVAAGLRSGRKATATGAGGVRITEGRD